jgi:hypothetical protein
VRDSLGTEIIEHPEAAIASTASWMLSLDPVLAVGEAEASSEFELSNVVSAVRVAEDRVAVALGYLNEIRFYGLAGDYMGSAGREGGGPGEFRGIRGMWLFRGDSLAVYDYGNARITILTTEGRLGRVFPLGQVPGRPTPLPVAPFSDGSFLGRAHLLGTEEGRAEGVHRGEVLFVRWSPTGEFLDSLAMRPDGERYFGTLDGRVMMASPPFSRAFAVTVQGDAWYYGSMSRYEIEQFGEDGRLRRILRRRLEPRAVTPEERDAWVEQAEERWAQMPPAALAWRLAMPFPETFPAHDAVLADSEGNLWVSRYARLPGESQTWDVYAPDGRFLSAVVMPAGGRVTDVGLDYVLGVWRDEFDVEQVRMYRLNKPG